MPLNELIVRLPMGFGSHVNSLNPVMLDSLHDAVHGPTFGSVPNEGLLMSSELSLLNEHSCSYSFYTYFSATLL